MSGPADDAGSYKPALTHFHRGIGEFAKLGIPPACSLDLTCVWVDRGGGGRKGLGLNIPSDANPLCGSNMAELAAHLCRDRG
ncbi:MAG: hypothetical protein IIC57_04805 [Proteobacteria bacterium]|nr:hypothetical protein [Pseudomonadota bacterium]